MLVILPFKLIIYLLNPHGSRYNALNPTPVALCRGTLTFVYPLPTEAVPTLPCGNPFRGTGTATLREGLRPTLNGSRTFASTASTCLRQSLPSEVASRLQVGTRRRSPSGVALASGFPEGSRKGALPHHRTGSATRCLPYSS